MTASRSRAGRTGSRAQQSLATISLAEGDPRRAEGELGPYLELASASGDALALDAEELTLAVDVLVAVRAAARGRGDRRPPRARLPQRVVVVLPGHRGTR